MKNNLELYLVRHGDAIKHNSNGAELEDEARTLSPKGTEDISTLAKHLLELHVAPDIIVSSFFVRAQETTQIIAEYLDNPVILKSDLIGEADLGTTPHSNEGLLSVQYGYDTEKIIQAGGETVEQVEKRITEFLEFLRNSEFSSVIVLSHGLPLSIMSQILQGLNREFETIQALKTDDYSYFLLEPTNGSIATTAKTNVLKGKLAIN